MNQKIIIVDEYDNIMGYEEKLKTHIDGLLHRAFSIFLFDRNTREMLIQKRALTKYHSGGLWSNACCSHPYKDELWRDALQRCMKNELGIIPPFKKNFIEEPNLFNYPPCTNTDRIQLVKTFRYCSKYSYLIENEIDYVFLYHPDREIRDSICVNSDEVDEIKWISLEKLDLLLSNSPELFTSWFSRAYEIAKVGIFYEDSWSDYEEYGFCLEIDD